MNAKNAFREIAIDLAPKQPQLVDYLLEEAPALELVPFFPTTDGMNHVFEELEDVVGNGLVDADAPLPSVTARTGLKQTALSVLGGRMEIGEDKAKQMGGAGVAFQKRLPQVLKKTGKDTEQSVIYNNLRATAIETRNSGVITGSADHAIDAGGIGAVNYSIVVVKYEEGQLGGLYNPDGFGRGMLFDMEPINGGSLYDLRDNPGVLGYGMRLKSYFGMLMANPRNVASIVNVDLDLDGGEFKALPTAAMIDDAIDAVRGMNNGNTVMYMHPTLAARLRVYKENILQMQIQERNLDRQLEAWNGIPIITTYNMLKRAEPRVTF